MTRGARLFSASIAEDLTPSGSDVTPSRSPRAVYVGGAGDVKVDMRSGGTVTFSGVQAGSMLSISVSKVYDTGTTATGILGLA